MMKTILRSLFFLFSVSLLAANNLQVSAPTLTGQVISGNLGTHYTFVKFTVSWDNSWRDPLNWDAAWIFVKYKIGTGEWLQATLPTAAENHTAPNGCTITPTADGKGVFIYRNTNGTGSVNYTDVQLRWNYGADGVGDNDIATVKVFGIEMVYVPQGSFYVGDGTTTEVHGQFSDGATTNPFLITGEGSITLGGGVSGSLGNRNAVGMSGYADDFNNTTSQTLPVWFPKGYNAFYCMKYEICQGQYSDFLNSLTSVQASNRFPDKNGNARHTISVSGSVYSAARPDRACNYVSWADGAAYADWSGLRPMTELEFEKACRGDQPPVDGEFAWGSTNIVAATVINGAENGTEYITTPGANCSIGNIFISGGDGSSLGPLRCGIFARGASTREQAGATYYGILEMSGNLIERLISVGSVAGRTFQGNHGNGMLDDSGNSDVSTWPSNTSTIGVSMSGGALSHGVTYVARVSNREDSNYPWPLRTYSFGFRGVRTAP